MKLAHQVSTRPPLVGDGNDDDVKERVDGINTFDVEVISLSSFAENDTDVPQIVGAFSLDPLDHERPGAVTTYKLQVVGEASANAGRVSLHNLSDGLETSAIITFTSGVITTYEVAVPRGVAATDLKDGERIYEARIRLSAPQGASEDVKVYSISLVIEHAPVATSPGNEGPGDGISP